MHLQIYNINVCPKFALGHHVCLFFTQYTPYTLSNGRTWDEKTREEYADLIFNTVESYAPGNIFF